MVACCIPWTLNKPALRSSVLNSFISRLLFRVHAADSNEHHAVLSVARAINKAATGSTHFLFSAGSASAAVGRSDCVFMRLKLALFVRLVKNAFAYDDKEKCGRETEHQNSCEALDRAEHTPFFRQHEIAVPNGGVGNRRKVERRLNAWQTFRNPEKQGPHEDREHVNHDQQPGDTNQQPCDWPEARIFRSYLGVQHMGQYHSEPRGVNCHCDSNQASGQ